MRPFVFHNLRRTFLTQLGESGVDAWTLMRITGHSNIKQSDQAVHPAMNALARGGYKTGYSVEKPRKTKLLKSAFTTV